MQHGRVCTVMLYGTTSQLAGLPSALRADPLALNSPDETASARSAKSVCFISDTRYVCCAVLRRVMPVQFHSMRPCDITTARTWPHVPCVPACVQSFPAGRRTNPVPAGSAPQEWQERHKTAPQLSFSPLHPSTPCPRRCSTLASVLRGVGGHAQSALVSMAAAEALAAVVCEPGARSTDPHTLTLLLQASGRGQPSAGRLRSGSKGRRPACAWSEALLRAWPPAQAARNMNPAHRTKLPSRPTRCILAHCILASRTLLVAQACRSAPPAPAGDRRPGPPSVCALQPPRPPGRRGGGAAHAGHRRGRRGGGGAHAGGGAVGGSHFAPPAERSGAAGGREGQVWHTCKGRPAPYSCSALLIPSVSLPAA